MNYAQARQRESDGRWDYTVRNDDRIWRTGYCADHEDGHATKEEAEKHFYDYELDQPFRIYEDINQQAKCVVCGEWTQNRVMLYDGYTTYILCKDHQTKEDLMKVRPFTPGMSSIYS